MKCKFDGAGWCVLVATGECEKPIHTGPPGTVRIEPIAKILTGSDMVNEPPHYRGVRIYVADRKVGGTDPAGKDAFIEIEAIDVIEALGLGYRLGTTLKYLWRAGKKGARIEDLKKARWFLDREIASAERGE